MNRSHETESSSIISSNEPSLILHDSKLKNIISQRISRKRFLLTLGGVIVSSEFLGSVSIANAKDKNTAPNLRQANGGVSASNDKGFASNSEAPSNSDLSNWNLLAEELSPKLISNPINGSERQNVWWVKRDIPLGMESLIDVKTRVISMSTPFVPTIVYAVNQYDDLRHFNLNYAARDDAWYLNFSIGQPITQKEPLGVHGDTFEGSILIHPDGRNITVQAANGEKRNILYEPGLTNGTRARFGYVAERGSEIESIYTRFSQRKDPAIIARTAFFEGEVSRLITNRKSLIPEGEERVFSNPADGPAFKNEQFSEVFDFRTNKYIEASVELPENNIKSTDAIGLVTGKSGQDDYRRLDLSMLGGMWQFRIKAGANREELSPIKLGIRNNRIDLNYLVTGDILYAEMPNGEIQKFDIPGGFYGDEVKALVSVPKDYSFKVNRFSIS